MPVSSWIRGEVFATFDRQDSGNLSYGVRDGDRRYFVKTAGGADPARVARLRTAIAIAACSHPALSRLDRVIETPEGPVLAYDWFDGEPLGVPKARRGDPASSFQRFRALPRAEIAMALIAVVELHVELVRLGWIASDFYDGCLMYDFATSQVRVIDLDEYARGPFVNAKGRLLGSTRFMAPEEFVLGATIDERTTVFNLGRAAEVFLGVTTRACEPDPANRFATVAELLASLRQHDGLDG